MDAILRQGTPHRRPRTGIVAYNPGVVPGTGLSRDANAIGRFMMMRVVPLMALTPLADTMPVAGRKLAEAVSGRTSAPSGSYVDRGRVTPSSGESYDPGREQALWDYADEVRAGIATGSPG